MEVILAKSCLSRQDWSCFRRNLSFHAIRTESKLIQNSFHKNWVSGDDLMFCSFTLNEAYLRRMDDPFDAHSYRQSYPSVRFSYLYERDNEEVSFPAGGESFWREVSYLKTCNPDDLLSSNSNQWPWILSEIDSTAVNIECEQGQNLLILYDGNLYSDAEYLKCENHHYIFKTKSSQDTSQIQYKT
ncbi:hypothetical protein PFISCL1PPCAC_18647, partial [Pristionchus fissidentatus]